MGAAKVSEPEEERRVLAITDLRLGQCGLLFWNALKTAEACLSSFLIAVEVCRRFQWHSACCGRVLFGDLL